MLEPKDGSGSAQILKDGSAQVFTKVVLKVGQKRKAPANGSKKLTVLTLTQTDHELLNELRAAMKKDLQLPADHEASLAQLSRDGLLSLRKTVYKAKEAFGKKNADKSQHDFWVDLLN